MSFYSGCIKYRTFNYIPLIQQARYCDPEVGFFLISIDFVKTVCSDCVNGFVYS